jgi:hypothetical protein
LIVKEISSSLTVNSTYVTSYESYKAVTISNNKSSHGICQVQLWGFAVNTLRTYVNILSGLPDCIIGSQGYSYPIAWVRCDNGLIDLSTTSSGNHGIFIVYIY